MTAIYLNHASHGLPDGAVTRRIIDHLEMERRIGAVAAQAGVIDELAAVRAKAAVLIGAVPEQTGLSTSTMVAWREYVGGLSMMGKRVLVARHEWGENIGFLRRLAARTGATVEALPPLDFTTPDLREWQAQIGDDVAGIFVPLVTSITGLRYPVEAIGALARPDGCALVVDAAQAVGQTPVDVTRLNCDALFATTRKWARGPRQTAVFWTRDPERIREIEPSDAHIGLRLGLGAALGLVLDRGVEAIAADLRETSDHIRTWAAEIGLACHADATTGTGTVTLAIPADAADRCHAALDAAAVIAKWPHAATDEPLSGLEETRTRPLRIAPHLSTDPSDLDTALAAIAGAVRTR